jgi:hypothetical protein
MKSFSLSIKFTDGLKAVKERNIDKIIIFVFYA